VISKTRAWQIGFATNVLREGGIIAHATEAVWGLACDPNNALAVDTLLRIKKRPIEKGLILVSGQLEHFYFLLNPLSEILVNRFSTIPTVPTTWLVPDVNEVIPRYVKGQHKAVALRLSQHTTVSALSASLGRPLISTSANPTARMPAKNVFQVNQYFGALVDYILPSRLGEFSRPSEIRDLVSDQVLRI